VSLGLFVLLVFGLLIVAAVVLFLPLRRSQLRADRPARGPIYRDDDRYWLGGLIYYNPDDPDAFIPKRYGMGWTVNFAHPAGKLILAVMIILILLPIALAIFVPGFAASGCHPSNCHLAP
jgi:uncharacterized membrane protein